MNGEMIAPSARRALVNTPGVRLAIPATRARALLSSTAPSPDSDSSAIAVATSPTPRTRSRTVSGWRTAYPMTVMPPIECPITTTGPVGAVAEMTVPRSRASCSIVEFLRELMPLSPCPRWS